MTKKEELRLLVTVWIDDGGLIKVINTLEDHLTPERIQEIAEDIDSSDAYANGFSQGGHSSLPFVNPYVEDTDDWWYWYAGYHFSKKG